MRTLEEINADIGKISGEKAKLDEQLHQLYIERGKRQQFDFEQKHGIKKGDLVQFRNGTKWYYDYLKPYGMFPWVYVRKPKKDGTPARNVESKMVESFIGCKVIGHSELP